MADENDIQQEEEQTKSIWDMLNMNDPDDEFEDAQEEQDEEIAKEDKLEKKLSAKMENMQKKFESTLLRERISKFEDSADDLEKDMFKTIISDIKNLEDFDKAMKIVKKQSAEIRATAEKYKERLEEEAKQRVETSWGTGPLGTPQRRTDIDAEERQKKIAAGDNRAALAALMEDDNFIGGRI